MTNAGKRSLALLLLSLIVIAGLGLVVLPAAQSQDETPPPAKKTFKLEIRYAKKDVLAKETKQNVDIDGELVITLDFGGQKQEIKNDTAMQSESAEKYTESILDVTDSNQAKKVKREYLSSSITTTTEKEEGGSETKKEDAPLDGKTLTIERTDDPENPIEVKVEGDKEGLPENLAALVTLDEGPVHLLPGKEVAVGETWNPSEDAMKKYFSGSLQGTGEAMPNMKIASISGTSECKLKDVVEEAGKSRAVVSFKMDAEIEMDPKAMLGGSSDSEGEEDSPLKDMSGEMTMKVKLTGEFDLVIEDGKLARHEFSGSLVFDMSTEQSFEGVGTADTSMKGTGNVEKTETWKVSKEE